jgi:predicted O-methyltransferase YrrM
METDPNEIDKIRREHELDEISNHVLRKLGPHKKSIVGNASNPFLKAEIIYTIVRIMQPSVMIETGVESGRSSAFILQALERNGKGVLHSIDLPNENLLKQIPSSERDGLRCGWVVPQNLKNRWHLVIDSTKNALPSLLNETDEMDLFLCDADHSYDSVMWEFGKCWPRLKNNGVLISDDSRMNDAFAEFSRDNGRSSKFLFDGLAAIRK